MPEKYFEEIDEETKIIYYYSFSSEVVKFFKKQPEIFRKLRTLRMRISDFRVIFLIKEKSDNLKIYTFIIKADNRGDIYKN